MKFRKPIHVDIVQGLTVPPHLRSYVAVYASDSYKFITQYEPCFMEISSYSGVIQHLRFLFDKLKGNCLRPSIVVHQSVLDDVRTILLWQLENKISIDNDDSEKAIWSDKETDIYQTLYRLEVINKMSRTLNNRCYMSVFEFKTPVHMQEFFSIGINSLYGVDSFRFHNPSSNIKSQYDIEEFTSYVSNLIETFKSFQKSCIRIQLSYEKEGKFDL